MLVKDVRIVRGTRWCQIVQMRLFACSSIYLNSQSSTSLRPHGVV